MGYQGLSHRTPAFEQPRSWTYLDLFEFYNDSYNPARLVRGGASASEVNRPGFSVFSSLASFHWLQNLAAHGIQYANVDYRDPDFYRHIVDAMNKENLRGLAVSVSNIIDCNYNSSGKCSAQRNLNSFLSMLNGMANGLAPIYVHYVNGTYPPHRFIVGKIGDLMKENSQNQSEPFGQTD